MANPQYLVHAERLACDIGMGRLQSGQKLPPIRQYAFEHGIAFSTAARVYAELTRRGLVFGEVGRGTYVLEAAQLPALSEPNRRIIDLEFNSTSVNSADMAILRDAMSEVIAGDLLNSATASVASAGSWLRRDLLAEHISRPGWAIQPEHVLAASGGRAALAAAFAALGQPGTSIGLEALTYPMAKAIAKRLGLRTVPLVMDEEGVLPEAIEKAYLETGTRLFYMQPTLQNPLGLTMGSERRERIAVMLERHGLYVIEDDVYGFLAPGAPPPIAALAPDRVMLVDSFSKRGFSGLPIGFICVASDTLRRKVSRTLRSGAWLPAPINLAFLSAILASGSLRDIEQRKREGAGTRQAVLRRGLGGWDIQADDRTFHAWLRLPVPWRSAPFVRAALEAGVAVTPGTNFAVQPGFAPDAVRLAFSAVSPALLADALARLRTVLSSNSSSNRALDPHGVQ